MELRALLFHEWANCPGVIIVQKADAEGAIRLRCAECGAMAAIMEEGFLEQLNEMFDRLPAKR